MGNIRTTLGNGTEERACVLLSKYGWWCHRFQRKANGAQPCDIVAMKKNLNMLLDAKHCEKPFLATSRIESNQITCFQMASKKGIQCGFVCEHKGILYFLPFETVDFNKPCQKLNDLPTFEGILSGGYFEAL